MINCRSRDQCEEMAQHLDWGYYHAGMVAEDRADRIEVLVSDSRFIVATSALGTSGVYPEIVYVLHIGVSYGMINFAQKSGRAGRGGEPVDSVVFVRQQLWRRLLQLEPRRLVQLQILSEAGRELVEIGAGGCEHKGQAVQLVC